jgi:hypothetical protein
MHRLRWQINKKNNGIREYIFKPHPAAKDIPLDEKRKRG